MGTSKLPQLCEEFNPWGHRYLQWCTYTTLWHHRIQYLLVKKVLWRTEDDGTHWRVHWVGVWTTLDQLTCRVHGNMGTREWYDLALFCQWYSAKYLTECTIKFSGVCFLCADKLMCTKRALLLPNHKGHLNQHLILLMPWKISEFRIPSVESRFVAAENGWP